MEKYSIKRKVKLGKIIIAILLCLFCSFSFVGCIGRFNLGGTGGSSSSGGGSGSGSGGSSGGSSGSDDDIDEPESSDSNVDDFNDVFLGAIGVYSIDGDEDVFYDRHLSHLVSFNDLVDRQFDTIANYIYSTLNRIYGNTDSSNNFIFNGYGVSKSLNYDILISDVDQKILTGFSTGILENKSYLNYTNAINGGYGITTVNNGDDTYAVNYDTNTVLMDNAWIGKDFFTKEMIKKTIAYIYANQQKVANASAELTFLSDTNLRNYYVNNFTLDNPAIVNFDINKIDKIGITNEFVWNISYYVAYCLIGKDNIDNSVNGYNQIFEANKIKTLTNDNASVLLPALEKYKGYNTVLADLMSNIVNLNAESNSRITITNSTWNTTLFPNLNKESYIYYDDINDVCDANNDSLSGDDEDYDFSEDEEYDESEMDNIDFGTAFKLKKIILIPYINLAKNNISTFQISGLLLGYQAVLEETYKVEMSITGLDKSGKEISPTKVEVGGGDNISGNQVIFDNEYKFSEDLVDVTIELGSDLSTLVTKSGDDIKTKVNNSFRPNTRTINYAGGGVKTINVGYFNVFNNLIDKDGIFDVKSSILELNFDYYSSNGQKLEEIPSTYLMYFYVF